MQRMINLKNHKFGFREKKTNVWRNFIENHKFRYDFSQHKKNVFCENFLQPSMARVLGHVNIFHDARFEEPLHAFDRIADEAMVNGAEADDVGRNSAQPVAIVDIVVQTLLAQLFEQSEIALGGGNDGETVVFARLAAIDVELGVVLHNPVHEIIVVTSNAHTKGAETLKRKKNQVK